MGSLAQASLTVVPFLGGQPLSGVNYVTFNTLPLGTAGGFTPNTAASANPGPANGITVNITSNAQAVTGSASGQYAAPVLSGLNGTKFDGQPNGVDATTYLTAGSTNATAGAKVELVFGSLQQYFGILWGSVDLYNTLEFFNGNVSVGSITGSAVDANATGSQGANGTFYVNINSTLGFDRVVATSSQFAFEFDNVAYGARQAIVPEATTIAVWSGLSLLGWVAYRRRAS
jgi:hypothetical protein